MPVIFNEPLSFLQRLTEYMEHTSLIHQANSCSDSTERMKVAAFHVLLSVALTRWLLAVILSLMCLLDVCLQCVAAFAVSAVASQWERTGKPFNPLLGETYELVR